MNKLSYGLLSFISTEPQTGYDLMRRLNLFWHTNHSAIYPLLSELEEKDYVNCALIEQIGKPDKKLYSITDQGMEALKKWIASTTDPEVVKDEMMFKLLCIQVLDKETIEILLTEMENRCTKALDYFNEVFEKLKDGVNGSINSFNAPKMGAYLLLQKKIAETELNMRWCSWVRSLYTENRDINFLDNNFTDSNFIIHP